MEMQDAPTRVCKFGIADSDLTDVYVHFICDFCWNIYIIKITIFNNSSLHS